MNSHELKVHQSAPKPKFVPRAIQSILETYVPGPILRMCRNIIWVPIRRNYGQLTVAEAFIRTYRNKLWGKLEDDEFFSGRGSLGKFTVSYVEWVTKFITEHEIRAIVDLGCGDFRIGQDICSANPVVNYIGVDIVPELIAYNQSQFGSERISFECANIIEGELPNGELCLIRQVLQHLSNQEISSVLANCKKFPYLLVTEGVYSGGRVRPNLDISHGPDTRIYKHSGVFLDRAPFNLQTENVLEVPCPELAAVIRTSLIERKDNHISDRGLHPSAKLG
jgi:hypothetical protein